MAANPGSASGTSASRGRCASAMIVGRYRGNAMIVGTQRRRAADKVER
jgi:hypothetical protein